MATTFADLVARVRGVELRQERNEEDITAIVTTVDELRHHAVYSRLLLNHIAAHLDIATPTNAEVEDALDRLGGSA